MDNERETGSMQERSCVEFAGYGKASSKLLSVLEPRNGETKVELSCIYFVSLLALITLLLLLLLLS